MPRIFFRTCFLVILPSLVSAQTSINPFVLYDFQKVNYSSLSTPPGSFAVANSGGIGIGIEQGINRYLGIAIESDYTRKQIDAPIATYAGLSGLSLT